MITATIIYKHWKPQYIKVVLSNIKEKGKMPRTRQQDTTQESAQTKLSPEAMKMMDDMMSPPKFFGRNELSANSALFGNIVHFAGFFAKDLTKGMQEQTEEVCDLIDKALAECNSNKNLIVRADIFIKDRSMLEDM
jgi:enamine deaminase RidA (YjgF/YER057c/UK114 family)